MHVKKRKNVQIHEYTTMTDIIVKNGKCAGILAKTADGEEMKIYAQDTIFASGGIGGRYQHSTNFPHLTGDALDISKSMESVWSIWIMSRSTRQLCILQNRGEDF